MKLMSTTCTKLPLVLFTFFIIGIEDLASWHVCGPRRDGFWVHLFTATVTATHVIDQTSRIAKREAALAQFRLSTVSENSTNTQHHRITDGEKNTSLYDLGMSARELPVLSHTKSKSKETPDENAQELLQKLSAILARSQAAADRRSAHFGRKNREGETGFHEFNGTDTLKNSLAFSLLAQLYSISLGDRFRRSIWKYLLPSVRERIEGYYNESKLENVGNRNAIVEIQNTSMLDWHNNSQEGRLITEDISKTENFTSELKQLIEQSVNNALRRNPRNGYPADSFSTLSTENVANLGASSNIMRNTGIKVKENKTMNPIRSSKRVNSVKLENSSKHAEIEQEYYHHEPDTLDSPKHDDPAAKTVTKYAFDAQSANDSTSKKVAEKESIPKPADVSAIDYVPDEHSENVSIPRKIIEEKLTTDSVTKILGRRSTSNMAPEIITKERTSTVLKKANFFDGPSANYLKFEDISSDIQTTETFKTTAAEKLFELIEYKQESDTNLPKKNVFDEAEYSEEPVEASILAINSKEEIISVLKEKLNIDHGLKEDDNYKSDESQPKPKKALIRMFKKGKNEPEFHAESQVKITDKKSVTETSVIKLKEQSEMAEITTYNLYPILISLIVSMERLMMPLL